MRILNDYAIRDIGYHRNRNVKNKLKSYVPTLNNLMYGRYKYCRTLIRWKSTAELRFFNTKHKFYIF